MAIPTQSAENNGARRACVNFRLGDHGFGLPLEQVSEIAAAGRIAPVPMAPPVVRGLANLRGRVVTLIDIARVFGRALPPARCPEDRLVLILAAPHHHLGVYVHAPVEIGHAVAAEAPARVMAALGGAGGAASPAGGSAWNAEDASALPSGAPAVISGEIIHLLSAAELIAHCEAKVLEGFRRKL